MIRQPRQYNIQDIYQELEAKVERRKRYAQMYTVDHADRLGQAYAAYPWVDAQILASLVLNDADDILPEVGRIVGERMAKMNVAPSKNMRRYV